MKKVIVTGGAGFIGSHTVVELINAGYEPIVIDNFANSSRGMIGQIEKITGKKVEFHEIDLCDKQKLQDFVDKNSDANKVIHFAAYKAVGESVKNPLKYYDNNINALINLLRACQGKKMEIVFSSSCTVYGEPDKSPVTEESPMKQAESPYGNTKKICEDIVRDAAAASDDLRIISLRYFNPAGAHSSALIGELPIGEPKNLIPFITQSAIGKRGAITVFGNDYDTPDGTCIRDYIHVVDLAKSHVAALKRIDVSDTSFEVFNIGTGKGSSVMEIINTFEKVSGIKPDYKIGVRRPGDIIKLWGDPSKAEKILSWKAERNLEDMLSSAWKWEQYLKENPIT